MNLFPAGMNAHTMGESINQTRMLVLMGHSLVLGLFLMIVTVWAQSRVFANAKPAPVAPAPPVAPVPPGAEQGLEAVENETLPEMLLSSANVLYLCFGMTAVMLLVANNIARAFAIGAAIALVRFRIKLNSKALSIALFYGVLTGMACGVDQLNIGYGIALTFGLLQILLLTLAILVSKKLKA
jgi:hypothetical protein